MPSLPLTPDQEKLVLREVGVQSVEDLFASIPPSLREQADFKFSEKDTGRGLTEFELRRRLGQLAKQNASEFTHFLGGGVYDNILPSLIGPLVSRGEFLTCYTPYQPEISQGTLQAIFEFQTLMCRLTGMQVANASLYDGSTATAEAVLMAQRISRKPQGKVLLADSCPPDYKKVVHTFLQAHAQPPVSLPWNEKGSVDLEALGKLVTEHEPYAVVVPSPNYFGILEPLDQIRDAIGDKTLLIVTVSDPTAFSVFETPAAFGADIVVGEAHQLGTPMQFGGPHVGFLATQKKYLRQLPGRLVGETIDKRGQRAYSLTLATREQHIRREKATSNICTNQGLIALRTTIYLSFLGKQGFQALGERNYSLFEYLTDELAQRGIPLRFKDGLHYREGVFQVPNLSERTQKALGQQIIAGIPMRDRFADQSSDFTDCLLICVHPGHEKNDIDRLVEVLSHV